MLGARSITTWWPVRLRVPVHAALLASVLVVVGSCDQGRQSLADEGASAAPGAGPILPVTTPSEPGPPGEWGSAPAWAGSEQIAAMEWVNFARHEAGLPFVTLSDELTEAATSHARCIVDNPEAYSDGLSLHEEKEGTVHFTGKKFWERITAAGYEGKAVGEVISYQPLATAAVWQWLDSVYHRLPLLSPAASSVGYGGGGDLAQFVTVMEVGSAPFPYAGSKLTAYPADGAEDVPVSWDGYEIPQPQPPPHGFPSGPVWTLQGTSGAKVAVVQHELLDPSGAPVAHTLLSGDNDAILQDYAAVALYADAPLSPDTVYRVRVTGTNDGAPFEWESTFRTERSDSCSPLMQDCAPGKGCYAEKSDTVCAWHGPVPEGGACSFQNDCASGSTCLGNVCRRYCDAASKGSILACEAQCPGAYSLLNTEGGGGKLGACAAPSCSPLMGGCGAGETCALTPAPACIAAGTASPGEACTSADDCMAGSACADIHGDGKAECYRVCDASPLTLTDKPDQGGAAGCFSACPGRALTLLDGSGIGLCMP